MALSRNAKIGIGLGAVVVLGGGLMLAAGGGKAKPKGGGLEIGKINPKNNPTTPPTTPGAVGGLAPGNPGSGISISLGCSVHVYDLALAQKTAYGLGRKSKTLEQARADLYKFGPCGVSERLRPDKSQMRNNYLVTFELLRGAVDSKKLPRQDANIQLRDEQLAIIMAGVSVTGLPVELP